MRMSLMEMDHQYELDQAVKQDRIQLVNGLRKQGQSKEKILTFLTTVMNLTKEQAQNCYQEALSNKSSLKDNLLHR